MEVSFKVDGYDPRVGIHCDISPRVNSTDWGKVLCWVMLSPIYEARDSIIYIYGILGDKKIVVMDMFSHSHKQNCNKLFCYGYMFSL